MEATDQYNDKIMGAVAEAESQPELPETLTLSTGVVIKRKAFSPFRLQDIVSKFKYPDVPKDWDNEHKRWLENYDQPQYVELCKQIDAERGLATIDVMIGFGTEIVSVPEGVEPLDSEGWVLDNEVFGTTFDHRSKVARYLSWVKSIATKNTEDVAAIAEFCSRSMGISEQEVSDKVNSFRGDS